MKITHEQLVELMNNKEVREELNAHMEPITTGPDGCCNECVKGQLGQLDRPWGQGHTLCNPLSSRVLESIRLGYRTTEFINGRWKVCNK